jgi:hypothetical protein
MQKDDLVYLKYMYDTIFLFHRQARAVGYGASA